MNGRVIQIFCMVVGIVLASSCGDECPVEQPYSVRVSVKDKNYLNISQFPQLGSVDENQPFRTYTGTIYYALYDASTGALKRESEIVQINGEDKEYTISFAGIPDGDYKLAVWGNLTTDYPAGILHQDGKEHTDIYVATRVLHFSPEYQTEELTLERTKGKLLLLCSNFPAEISRIEQHVNHVYQSVDADLNYSGSTQVDKSVPFTNMLETLLAPSSVDGHSKLALTFYATYTRVSESPYLKLPEMEVDMRRNEITAVSIDYNTSEGIWEIKMFIRGEWLTIHRLDIY